MADQSSHSLTRRCYAKKNDEDVARTDTSRRRTYLVRLSEQSERARAGETVEAEKSQMDGCSKGLFWFPRSLLAPSLLPSSHHIMRTPSFSPLSLPPSFLRLRRIMEKEILLAALVRWPHACSLAVPFCFSEKSG